MNHRIKIDPAEAEKAGRVDALNLITELCNPRDTPPATLLGHSLAEIIGLAIENRIEESQARLAGFCSIIGPMLADSLKLEALKAKCTLYAACLRQSDAALDALRHARYPSRLRNAQVAIAGGEL